jgi:hypothetical protein
LGLSNESFGDVKTVVLMHKGNASDEEIKAVGVESGVEIRVLSELLEATEPAMYSDLPTVGKSDLSTSKFWRVGQDFVPAVQINLTIVTALKHQLSTQVEQREGQRVW